MLVLSRKENERIKVGDSIVVTVVRVNGDKVRLGIDAPSDVVVLRGELEPHASPAIDGESTAAVEPMPDAGVSLLGTCSLDASQSS